MTKLLKPTLIFMGEDDVKSGVLKVSKVKKSYPIRNPFHGKLHLCIFKERPISNEVLKGLHNIRGYPVQY